MADKIYNISSFNRPPRLQDNLHPVEIDIPAPPVKPDETARNLLMALLPMSSFLVMGLFYALVFSRGSGGLGWLYALPMLFIAAFTFAISYITFGEQKYEQKQRWIKQLRDYHRLLDKKESRLLAARELQERLLVKRFSSPHKLLQRVKDMEITVWERRKDDPDFLALRLGIGEVPSSINIKPPDPDINSPEIRRAFGMYVEYKKIPEVPVTVDLQKVGSLALVGSRSLTAPIMRALIAQLSILNSPDDVHLYLFSSEAYYQTWGWMRWLPHTSEDHVGGRPSFMAFKKNRSKALLASISKLLDNARQTSEQSKVSEFRLSNNAVLLFDNESGVRDEATFWDFVKLGKNWGIFSIFMCEKMEDVPSECGSVFNLFGDAPASAKFGYSIVGAEGYKINGRPDRLAFIEMDNLSHRLLPVVVRSVGRNSQIPTRVNFMQMHEANTVEDLGIAKRWMRVPAEDGLLPFRVRLGSETYKDPLIVNLSENNDGPHGLIAGTTGSGKSELLQTLVGSLALEHHPYFLNFMFIDFKGASTFGVFEKLPHTVGLISNLDKLSASRALEALNTENLRRQNILRDLKLKEITDYHKRLLARKEILDPGVEPLPHLFVIVDEFAQMASDMPEFLDRLNEIARVGRSLGIHLVLATQRPANVVKDEMRANLNFRICLRVQTIDDSRDMLRRSDAAFLPPDLPGRAYFQLGDAGTLRQFQVARVGVEHKVVSPENQKYDLYRVEYEEDILIEDGHQIEKQISEDVVTITKALVEEITLFYGTMPHKKMNPLLLPPLDVEIEIQSICNHSDDGFDWNRWWMADWVDKWKNKQNSEDKSRKMGNSIFQVPVGLLDSLATHSQPPYYLNFLDKGGHVMAIGGPQSGKTSFLQSLCFSLVTHYSPAQMHLYILSFAGKDLDILEGLPHVGSVIDGSDSERFGRLLRYLQNEMEFRKSVFSEKGAKDLAQFNELSDSEKQFPYICVFIDGFGSLRGLEYNNELDIIEKLLKLRIYGLHFVITGLQSSDIPTRLTNLIQHRIAFDLIDHSEYMLLVGRPDSLDFGTLPKGRCFVNVDTPPMRCQIGMPPSKAEWIALKEEMTSARKDKSKPLSIQILPVHTPLIELLVDKIKPEGLLLGLLGVDGDNLSSYWFDWKKFPHLLIGGAPQSGRTSLLRTVVLGLSHNYSPSEVNFVLIDSSNSLEQLSLLPHVISKVVEEEGFIETIANLQTELEYRRAHKDELHKLPQIFIVIDDYDLMCEAFINDEILARLGKHVRQDSDLGFHLLVSVLPENVTRSTDPLMKQFRLSRNGISLGGVEIYEDLGGRPTQSMRSEEFKEGRGYVFDRSTAKLVQFAAPDDKSCTLVLTEWNKYKKASWQRIAKPEKIEVVRSSTEPVANPDRSRSSSVSRHGSLIDLDKALELYKQQQQNEAQKKKGK